MSKKKQHVLPLGNGWAVKGEGNEEFTVITETQKEAVQVAMKIARHTGTELIIHGRDGKIREKNNYGNISQ